MQMGAGFFPLTLLLYNVTSFIVSRKSKAKSSGIYFILAHPLELKNAKIRRVQHPQIPEVHSQGTLEATSFHRSSGRGANCRLSAITIILSSSFFGSFRAISLEMVPFVDRDTRAFLISEIFLARVTLSNLSKFSILFFG